jgi:hypothetical protein
VDGRRSHDRDGFHSFLKEMHVWKMRKEKKIRDLQNQEIQKEIELGLYQPRISHNSVKIIEAIKSKKNKLSGIENS